MTTRAGSDKGHLAYHLIQSFEPGEATPELAHQIGKELADSIFKINESKIIAFQGAADRLKAAGIDLKRFDEKVYKAYVEQDKTDQLEISQYEKARKQAEREKTELEIKMKELDMFMGGSFQREAQRDQEQDQPSKPKKGGDAR